MKFFIRLGTMNVSEFEIDSKYDICKIEFTLLEKKTKFFNTKLEAITYIKLIKQLIGVDLAIMSKEIKNEMEEN